jgi:uncharacterized protein
MMAGAKLMTFKSPLTLIAAFGAAVFFAMAPVASAADPIIDSAIAAGKVGETADGYLDVVDGKSVDAQTKRTVDEVNIKRRAVYTQLAAQKGVTVDQVAAVVAEKQVDKLPSGAYFQDASGAWKRK